MEVLSYIFIWIDCLRVWNYAFDSEGLNSIDVFNFFDEVKVTDFFWVAASGIASAEKVSQLFIFNQTQIIQNSDELFSCD